VKCKSNCSACDLRAGWWLTAAPRGQMW